MFRRMIVLLAAAGASLPLSVAAQTVKVGLINSYTGFVAQAGDLGQKGMDLYLKEHEKDLPPGVKIELIKRDDTSNPEVGKRLAQELITRERVQLLTGVLLSPVAAAVAPEIAEDEDPEPAAAPVDIEQLRTLWPAVVDAVCAENQMVGAFLKGARPEAIEAGRLTVAFAVDAGFAKKKIETNRALLQSAVRTLTGNSLELAFELRDGHDGEDPGERLLSGDELFERLKSEFGGTEVFDEEPS